MDCHMSVSPRISLFTNARLTTHLCIHQCPSHHASLDSAMSISPRISLFTNVRLTMHLFIHQCPSHHASLYSPMSISPRISLFTNVCLTMHLFIHKCPSHHASLYSPMSVSPRVSSFTSRVLWSRVGWKQSKQHCPCWLLDRSDCRKTRSKHTKRLKTTLFIWTKCNMRIFGVVPFIELQNNT